jgi:protease-4
MSDSDPNTPPGWERQLLQKLAEASLVEQRRARRWGVFFKLLTFIYLFVLVFLLNPEWDWKQLGEIKTDKHTALIEVNGIISADSKASADHVITGLRDAFEDKKTAGIIIRINSPGGSPVQAGYINTEIKRLRKKHPEIPLYAVVTDLCASGGYYIAAAADKIYVDKASLIGSIGVLMNGFGFVETMNKIGVERRLFTAGEHKGMLDPFSPQNPEDVAHIKTMLAQIHQQFIDIVKEGRGERLVKDNPGLFSGLIWTGEEAIKLGLADDLGSSSQVAREVIKAEDIVDFTAKEKYLDRLAERLGAGAASVLATQLQPSLR